MKITLESEGIKVIIEDNDDSIESLVDNFISAAIGITFAVKTVNDAIIDKAEEIRDREDDKSD